MNFRVDDKKMKKAFKIDGDRLERNKIREKPFTPESQAKRKRTLKEEQNNVLDSSDVYDVTGTESITDNESNLNSEKYFENKQFTK